MLKIKDNVELNELKKFGFKKVLNSTAPHYEKGDRCRIYIHNREIAWCTNETLFDLVQADLVEKV